MQQFRPESMFSLAGRTALVTGSTSGLGYAIARGLMRAGARVAVHGRDASRAAAAADALGGAIACAFDLADQDSLAPGVQALQQTVGCIDILVLNGGVRDRRPLADIERDDFERLMSVNLAANHELVRRLSPAMVERRWGRILFMGSIQSLHANGRSSSYATSKAGLLGLLHSCAVLLGPAGITSNMLSPGSFATEFNRAEIASENGRRNIEIRIPLRRAADPEEIVGPAVFLASDAASYVNGQTIGVDGGWSVAL